MNDLLIENSLNGRDVNDIVSKGLRRKTLDFVQWPEITIHGHVTFMVLLLISFLKITLCTGACVV